MTFAQAIQQAETKLKQAGVPDARLDAELLLCRAAQKDRAWLLAHFRDEIDTEVLAVFDRDVERRSRREPLQYITGAQEFRGLAFRVTPAVLIPRPETEFLVEAALEAVRGTAVPVIIDLCTGSGCIAVSMAKELPKARIFATDASPEALAVARENSRTHGVSGRIRFLEGDLFDPFAELDLQRQVDVIATNPPYVSSGDLAALPPEVRDFEPPQALFAGPRGTDIIERIVATAPEFLRPGGSLIMEIGFGQADVVKEFIEADRRYHGVDIHKDLAGIDRVVVAKKQ